MGTTKNESPIVTDTSRDFHINRHGRSEVLLLATTKNESPMITAISGDFHIKLIRKTGDGKNGRMA
ncbi:MAG: hypothetical protein HQK62_10545 [Desulfamplus sp.]|nr:hypothetical protein [Desulfamplus sp.]